MAVRGKVTGDKALIANIRRVSSAVGGRALDADIVHALEPMKDQTIAGALKHRQPHNPPGGHLDEGVVVVKRNARGNLYREYWLTFAKRARKLAHLVEFGTAPHYQPRRHSQHPGARPFPFFRPAFEETKGEVGMALGKSVWARISTSLKGVK